LPVKLINNSFPVFVVLCAIFVISSVNCTGSVPRFRPGESELFSRYFVFIFVDIYLEILLL
jgi:hypothetical protein